MHSNLSKTFHKAVNVSESQKEIDENPLFSPEKLVAINQEAHQKVRLFLCERFKFVLQCFLIQDNQQGLFIGSRGLWTRFLVFFFNLQIFEGLDHEPHSGLKSRTVATCKEICPNPSLGTINPIESLSH